ncbi:sigma 54-interacting transcriptional regulator [Burkholderia cepacia]|uniref:sigma 54-interacting transcriptional regulator n=1 Tax=Burkholderia cepacia TaxID=292 RepID=UPI002AB7D3D4|nr:sigma 54-interacting transcriptional regulator [Burkholderia cepacia]
MQSLIDDAARTHALAGHAPPNAVHRAADSLPADIGRSIDPLLPLAAALFRDQPFTLAIYVDGDLRWVRQGGTSGDQFSPLPGVPVTKLTIAPDATISASRITLTGQQLTLAIGGRLHEFAIEHREQINMLCDVGVALLDERCQSHVLRELLGQSVREREAVSDLIVEGLLVLDRNGYLKYINAHGEKILRLQTESRSFRELLGFEPILNSVFRSRCGYVDREVVISRHGARITLIDTAIPVFDNQGEVASVVNLFRPPPADAKLQASFLVPLPPLQLDALAGSSKTFLKLKAAVARVAADERNILIHGEAGTGKTAISRAIAARVQPGMSLTAIDCDRLSTADFETHVLQASKGIESARLNRGLFENARPRILLFRHVDRLSIDMQAALLGALAVTPEASRGAAIRAGASLRIIASLSDALVPVLRDKRLHPELYRFVAGSVLECSPLRHRTPDIDRLAELFWERSCNEAQVVGHPPLSLMRLLRRQDWPGNVAQLQEFVEQLFARLPQYSSERRLLDEARDLLTHMQSHIPGRKSVPGKLSIDDAERHAILLALQAMDFNMTKASKALGISRPTLYSKIRKYDLRD